VGKAHFATVAALDDIGGLKGIVSATAIAAGFGQFTFWLRNHDTLLSELENHYSK